MVVDVRGCGAVLLPKALKTFLGQCCTINSVKFQAVLELNFVRTPEQYSHRALTDILGYLVIAGQCRVQV